jgi:hypothetical protein
MQIELPDKLIDEIAERVRVKLGTESSMDAGQLDSIALDNQLKLARIKVKENISVQEAAFLLNCSDGHIRNLVKKAKYKRTRHPIPYNDLDGVVTFNPEKLLVWSRQPKERANSGQKGVQSESNV